MRRHGPIRVLLSLLLAAWLPWCLCGQVAMGCCPGPESRETPAESADEPRCGGACCVPDQAPAGKQTSAPDDGCRPFGSCEAGCCVTKGPVPTSVPEIRVDSIGTPLPATVLVAADDLVRIDRPDAIDGRSLPAGPRIGTVRADSARRLRAALCIRTT